MCVCVCVLGRRDSGHGALITAGVSPNSLFSQPGRHFQMQMAVNSVCMHLACPLSLLFWCVSVCALCPSPTPLWGAVMTLQGAGTLHLQSCNMQHALCSTDSPAPAVPGRGAACLLVSPPGVGIEMTGPRSWLLGVGVRQGERVGEREQEEEEEGVGVLGYQGRMLLLKRRGGGTRGLGGI